MGFIWFINFSLLVLIVFSDVLEIERYDIDSRESGG